MKTLIYRSCLAPEHKEKKIFGDDLALKLKNRPALFPTPEPEPEPEQKSELEQKPPAPLDYSCRRCGAFAFIPIDLCDECMEIESKRKRRKPRRKKKASKPTEKVFKEPEKAKFEKLTVEEVERKKIDLNRVQRERMKFHFGPDTESATDKEQRLAKLKKLQVKSEYLFELIGYNIDLYLNSPRLNIYKNSL